jgi:hypothetical protein
VVAPIPGILSIATCGATAAGMRRSSARTATRKRGLDRETQVQGYVCYACQQGTATLGAEQSIPLSGRYVVIDIPGGMVGM